jgi:hypothetical protein
MSDFSQDQFNRLYDALRDQVKHEDDLIGQRINWFVASQSFLFSAYAIVLSNIGNGKTQAVADQQHLLVLMIPVLANVLCMLAWITVYAGEVAITRLRKQFDPLCHAANAAGLPPIQGVRRTQVLGMLPPLLLPMVFFGVWTLMLVHGLTCGLHPL